MSEICGRLQKATTVYIAGPMSGLPEFNYPAFNLAEERLRAAGFVTRNPAKNGLPIESEWCDHMRADIAMLIQSEVIYMLKGWEKSKGACLEHVIAESIGMPIMYEQNPKTQDLFLKELAISA